MPTLISDTDIFCTMQIMLTNLLNREVLGIAYLAYLAMSTMPIIYRTLVQLGSIGNAYLALRTMPLMPTHLLNWEVLGLHIWHCAQCQLCRHTC